MSVCFLFLLVEAVRRKCVAVVALGLESPAETFKKETDQSYGQNGYKM